MPELPAIGDSLWDFIKHAFEIGAGTVVGWILKGNRERTELQKIRAEIRNLEGDDKLKVIKLLREQLADLEEDKKILEQEVAQMKAISASANRRFEDMSRKYNQLSITLKAQ